METGRESAPTDLVTFRRFPDGFEIALLPPPRLKCRKKDLLVGIVFGLFFLLILGLFTGMIALFTKDTEGIVVGLAGFWVILLVIMVLSILSQFDWTRETAVLEARAGLLTLVRSGGYPPAQWSLTDLKSVRVWPIGDDDNKWALQITRNNGDVHLTLDGRRKRELDWVSGLLRAALAPPRRSAPIVAAPVVYTAGGKCQVCGSEMERWIVLCTKCRTPHHEECWTYNGACSTYGCREIRFTRTA